jgi:pimeloyl-ACP methyl ester carboxylesterase
MTRVLSLLTAALSLTALTWASPPPSSAAESTVPDKVASIRSATTTVHHRTIRIDGLNLFYRESGPPDAPLIVLLHGFPSSSHMFRNLLPVLSHRYHVIAPDYPGFGESEAPDRTELVDSLLTRLDAKRYALYVMDYGAPVGYRLALRHPERVSALVVQNGNAYAEGLLEFWDPIKAYWATGAQAQRDVLRQGTTFEATRSQYLDGVRDSTRVDPAAWVYDQARLDRPGNVEIQLDLFYDYRTNVDLYPRFQAFFRERQPPTLIVWGKNDRIFPAPGARAYLRDLPNAELHLLDTGHFALEDKWSEVALLMLDFFDRTLIRR